MWARRNLWATWSQFGAGLSQGPMASHSASLGDTVAPQNRGEHRPLDEGRVDVHVVSVNRRIQALVVSTEAPPRPCLCSSALIPALWEVVGALAGLLWPRPQCAIGLGDQPRAAGRAQKGLGLPLLPSPVLRVRLLDPTVSCVSGPPAPPHPSSCCPSLPHAPSCLPLASHLSAPTPRAPDTLSSVRRGSSSSEANPLPHAHLPPAPCALRVSGLGGPRCGRGLPRGPCSSLSL